MLGIEKKETDKKHSVEIIIWLVFIVVMITVIFFLIKTISTFTNQESLNNITVNSVKNTAISRYTTSENVSVMITTAQD